MSHDAASSPDQPNRPVRNMDDIARMLLAGARDRAASGRRTPPQATRRAAVSEPIPQDVERSEEAVASAPTIAAPESPAAPVPAGLPTVQLALSALPSNAAWAALTSAARHLAADTGKAVAVVGVHDGAMKLLRAGDARHGTLAVSSRLESTPLDLQLARALFGMRENVELWLVALPIGRAMDHLLAGVRDWLLISTTDNASIVAAYGALKNAVASDPVDDPLRTRVFLDCDDYAQAAVIHARLRRAAGEFLSQDLALAGVTGKTPADIQTVAEFRLPGDLDIPAWSSVGEFLHDLIAADTEASAEESETDEPEPADSDLSATLDTAIEESSPSGDPLTPETPAIASFEPFAPLHAAPISLSTPVEQIAAEAPPRPATPPAPTRAPADVTATIPAIETTSLAPEALWNIIVSSAPVLCGEAAEALEARPPHDPHAALFLDAAGRLHLWTLVSSDTAFLLAWQWARDHRQILALTRRDRWLDPACDIHLHAVLPPGASTTRPNLPHLTWYRLTPLRLADRTLAAVVPLS